MRVLTGVTVIAVLCSLSACAHTLYKPGATAQDFAVDRYACNKDVAQSLYAGSIAGIALYNQCMQAHGWHPQK